MIARHIGIDAGLACSDRPTGVENFARCVLTELIRLPEQTVDWFLYLPPGANVAVPPDGRVTCRNRPDVNIQLKAPWIAVQTWLDRLDVIYSFGHKLPFSCRGRRVITVYDTIFDTYPECYPQNVPARAHAEIRAACRGAAAVITVSEASKRALKSDYCYPAERIHVVPGAAHSTPLAANHAAIPEKVTAAGITRPYFLTVGRLDKRKNVQRVVDAYRLLLRSGERCGGLVIAGPDDTGSSALTAQLARDRVEGERIVTTGYVADSDLATLYRNAAGLVFVSLAEGFGLPVLEAMALGTPTITSNISSIPEVSGNATLTVDPLDTQAIASAMRLLLTNPDVRNRLEKEGPLRAAHFSWYRSAECLLSALLQAPLDR